MDIAPNKIPSIAREKKHTHTKWYAEFHWYGLSVEDCWTHSRWV